MDGCGDGVWNNHRYFNCRPGHGLFCPISSLKTDERFAPTSMSAGNRKIIYVMMVVNKISTSHTAAASLMPM